MARDIGGRDIARPSSPHDTHALCSARASDVFQDGLFGTAHATKISISIGIGISTTVHYVLILHTHTQTHTHTHTQHTHPHITAMLASSLKKKINAGDWGPILAREALCILLAALASRHHSVQGLGFRV